MAEKVTFELQVLVPHPCHEDWNTMTPDNRGRFCGSCSKSVVDFTAMTRTEFQDFISVHRDEQVCGRFHSLQIDHSRSRREQLFVKTRQWVEQHTVKRWTRAALMMAISWGMLLTGCSRSHVAGGLVVVPTSASLPDTSTTGQSQHFEEDKSGSCATDYSTYSMGIYVAVPDINIKVIEDSSKVAKPDSSTNKPQVQ